MFNAAFDKIVLIDRDKRDEMLQETEFTLSEASDSTEYAVRLGRFLTADYIVFGHFMKFGTNFHIVLRLVDVGTTKVVGSVREKAVDLDGIEKILTAGVSDLFSNTGIFKELTLFRFKYEKNEKSKSLAEVNETVLLNSRISHKAIIESDVEVEVLDIKDNFALVSSRFKVTEKASGVRDSFTDTQEYQVEFWMNELGKYRIDASAYMPVFRDIPLFPERPIEVGESWEAPAEEVHDFRRNFHIYHPFRIPLTVKYKYLRKENLNGKEIAVIEVRYVVNHEVPIKSGSQVYPKQIIGESEQIYYWDIGKGWPHSYKETFSFTFILSNGDSVSYRGESQGKIIE